MTSPAGSRVSHKVCFFFILDTVFGWPSWPVDTCFSFFKLVWEAKDNEGAPAGITSPAHQSFEDSLPMADDKS